MKQRPTRHSYLVPRAALRKMTSQNYPMGSKMNSDGPQRTPVCPSRSQDAWIRVNNRHFSYTKNTVKKMNYGHWTGCNLLQTDAGGIISPDILFIVHKAKVNSIYMKQSLPQLHIIRFQKDSAISLYWAYTAVLCSSAQPGTHPWFPEQLSEKWRRRTIPWGLKWTLMAPRERQFAP